MRVASLSPSVTATPEFIVILYEPRSTVTSLSTAFIVIFLSITIFLVNKELPTALKTQITSAEFASANAFSSES